MSEQAKPPRWNPPTNYYLVLPGQDGMVRVLTVNGKFSTTKEGKVAARGHVLSERDMTLSAAQAFTMDLTAIEKPEAS